MFACKVASRAQLEYSNENKYLLHIRQQLSEGRF